MPNVDVKAALTRKLGPLPTWGWGVAIGGGFIAYRLITGKGFGGGSAAGFPSLPEGAAGESSGGLLGDLPGFPDSLFSPTPSPSSTPIGFDPSPSTTPINLQTGSQAIQYSVPKISDVSLPAVGIRPIETAPTFRPPTTAAQKSVQQSIATGALLGVASARPAVTTVKKSISTGALLGVATTQRPTVKKTQTTVVAGAKKATGGISKAVSTTYRKPGPAKKKAAPRAPAASIRASVAPTRLPPTTKSRAL